MVMRYGVKNEGGFKLPQRIKDMLWDSIFGSKQEVVQSSSEIVSVATVEPAHLSWYDEGVGW